MGWTPAYPPFTLYPLWKVSNTQWKYPSARGEWSEQVKCDLESFGMYEELETIKKKNKFSFKALVKKQARELALKGRQTPSTVSPVQGGREC